MNEQYLAEIKTIASDVRMRIINTVERTGTGHIASAFSMVEILCVLFRNVLSYGAAPELWSRQDRDRFVLSKGHGALSLYAVLEHFGFGVDMESYLRSGTNMTAFPCVHFPTGLDYSSGSLGLGLSVASGLAYGLLNQHPQSRVFAVCSDGECQEGSTWEAAQFAGHHKLSNLVVIVDCNKIQAFGFVRDVLNQDQVGLRWQSLGFDVLEADGHDPAELLRVLKRDPNRRCPLVILAHTIKGKGVSFMENNMAWHYLPIKPDLAEQARDEILKAR